MKKTSRFVGIDVANDNFVVSIFTKPEQPIISSCPFDNSTDGFSECVDWLQKNNVRQKNSILCMESTGVYSEKLAYYLFAHSFSVVIEHPLKVKRAFEPAGHKTDVIDSKHIAEYAFRFFDELSLWKPRQEIIEQMKQILSVRDLCVKHKTALSNSLRSSQAHVVTVPVLLNAQKTIISVLSTQIKIMEKELESCIAAHPATAQTIASLKTIPGVGLLLAATLFSVTNGFACTNPKQIAAYVGIAPYQYESGSSVFRSPRCRRYGPKLFRRLLRLAAQSVVTHVHSFKVYYFSKCSSGKPKALALNNVANKLLKIACSIVQNKTVYIPDYRSLSPVICKSA